MTPRRHDKIVSSVHLLPLVFPSPVLDRQAVAERESHHVFLEPESLHTNEIYCNGISTSLPVDVQERLVHLMPGLDRARILRYSKPALQRATIALSLAAGSLLLSVIGLFD